MPRLCLVLALAAACGDGDAPRSAPEAELAAKPRSRPNAGQEARSGVPDRVVYDQILIAFKGSYQRLSPDKSRMIVQVDTERTREEARALARSLLERAQSGFDFRTLRQEYSDDRDARGVARGPRATVKDHMRRDLEEITMSSLGTAASDVIYRLKVGECGLVEYDERLFRDGWLVVQRIE